MKNLLFFLTILTFLLPSCASKKAVVVEPTTEAVAQEPNYVLLTPDLIEAHQLTMTELLSLQYYSGEDEVDLYRVGASRSAVVRDGRLEVKRGSPDNPYLGARTPGKLLEYNANILTMTITFEAGLNKYLKFRATTNLSAFSLAANPEGGKFFTDYGQYKYEVSGSTELYIDMTELNDLKNKRHKMEGVRVTGTVTPSRS